MKILKSYYITLKLNHNDSKLDLNCWWIDLYLKFLHDSFSKWASLCGHLDVQFLSRFVPDGKKLVKNVQHKADCNEDEWLMSQLWINIKYILSRLCIMIKIALNYAAYRTISLITIKHYQLHCLWACVYDDVKCKTVKIISTHTLSWSLWKQNRQ